MKVKIIDRTEEFIVLETTAPGLPARRTSVHIDAIVDGRTTIQEQKQIAMADGIVRLRRLNAMNVAILEDDGE